MICSAGRWYDRFSPYLSKVATLHVKIVMESGRMSRDSHNSHSINCIRELKCLYYEHYSPFWQEGYSFIIRNRVQISVIFSRCVVTIVSVFHSYFFFERRTEQKWKHKEHVYDRNSYLGETTVWECSKWVTKNLPTVFFSEQKSRQDYTSYGETWQFQYFLLH